MTNWNIAEKTVLVTGGAGGIGLATAHELVRRGARVGIVGRRPGRADEALQELRRAAPGATVEAFIADLSGQDDNRRLAGEVAGRFGALHVLINNVGGLYAERWETVDGIEATLAMNLINPFLLTRELLPLLQGSSPARIVNVTSGGHRFARAEFGDARAQHWYRGLDVYGRAKLFNLHWSYELARRLDGSGVTVNVADPGGAWTAMTQAMVPGMAPWFVRMLWPLGRRFQQSLTTEKAAASSVHLAAAPELNDMTGRYFDPKGRPARSSKASYDRDAQTTVWALCEQLCAVDNGARASRDATGGYASSR